MNNSPGETWKGYASYEDPKIWCFNHSTQSVSQHRLLSFLLTISSHKTYLQRHKFQI